jgi:hypothetical protein
MPVKDLYYQKYLKYKTKYLNLLSQTGGAPIFITKEDDTITINNEAIDGSHPFSVEELRKSHITTIKLKNVMLYYNVIFPKLKDRDFSKINRLIFDGINLSEIFQVDLILNLINLFTNVSTITFNNCTFTDKSSSYLKNILVNEQKNVIIN